MAEKRYIYASVGLSFEILDSWFGYTGDDEPTEREIEEYDYLVIGLASDQDSADGICRRLNDQQDELNHLSNFGLHVILDKKNKEIEQLKSANSKLIVDKNGIQGEYEWLKDENEQLKQTLDELANYDKEKGLEMEYINNIYKENGFKGIIEYAKDQLSEYGAVREVDKGLWLFATGGWSDHEYWLDCLLNWNFMYGKGHYRATTSGGGYYYTETPYEDIEIKKRQIKG